jgi:hypothetical protein
MYKIAIDDGKEIDPADTPTDAVREPVRLGRHTRLSALARPASHENGVEIRPRLMEDASA